MTGLLSGRKYFAVLASAAILLTGLPATASAAPGDILTAAGGGDGDTGQASAANLYGPAGVSVDSSGNIYIADTGNHRIRKVDASTGVITTVAGNGTPAYAGDNGQAISASLYNPTGVFVDSSNNIYIADQGNQRIRKVDASTGVITTVAGNGTSTYAGDNGPATSASLNYPMDVSVGPSGNIYIADTYNHRIRKVDVSTGIILTLAGNGTGTFNGDNVQAASAGLNYPKGVFVDSLSNVFIADTFNHRIRKVDASSGEITTIAGNGTPAYSGDNGQATSASLLYPDGVFIASSGTGTIYIADTYNHRIREVDASSGVITTIAGNGTATYAGDNGQATSASLSSPSGLSVDSSGNIYIADSNNNRIRKINTSTGVITAVAGDGTQMYSGDNGPATSASLFNPIGASIDSSGNIYIADTSNCRIRKVDASTGVITTVAGDGAPAFSGDNGQATSASLNYPYGVTVDSSGNIYIADSGNHRIRKVDASTGVITTVAGDGTPAYSGDNGQATSASLNYPTGVSVDSSDNISIADSSNNRIRKVTTSTGVITTIAGDGTPAYSGDNGQATSASLNYPAGISVDSSGNIYIADFGNHRIRKVTASTGVITTVAGEGTPAFSGDYGQATSASLNNPYGVSVDSSGNIYIADQGNQRIRKVDALTWVITTVAGNGTPAYSGDNGQATSASLNNPFGVSVDFSGNIYIADTSNCRIRKVINVTLILIANTSPAAGSVTTTADVGYTLSEQASTGKVTFTRTGGSADPSSPQTYPLSSADLLTAGSHTVNTGLGLVDGTIYTVSFEATDSENNTTTVSNASVTFTLTGGAVTSSPMVSHNTPTLTGWTVSFTDTSTDPDGTTDAVKVNWGDGTVDTGVAGGGFTHTYSNLRVRNYIISHMVIDPVNPRLIAVERFSVNVPQRYTVSGIVTTSTGAPMGNAYVYLKQTGHTKQYKKTASNGRFSFLNVPPGDFTVHVYKFGTAFAADTTISNLSSDQTLTITATRP